MTRNFVGSSLNANVLFGIRFTYSLNRFINAFVGTSGVVGFLCMSSFKIKVDCCVIP